MTAATLVLEGRRVGLDQLVRLLSEPTFAFRFRRTIDVSERPGHVSPTMLALESPRSKYVKRWRRHARSCPSCAAAFRHFGLPLA